MLRTTTNQHSTGRVCRVIDEPTGTTVLPDEGEAVFADEVDDEADGRVELSHRADVALARRWARRGRRVAAVVIDTEADTARVHGIGHRLPFVRRVPVPIALGLAAIGVPTRVVGRRSA